ncbi:MAG: alpha/beta hydrolase-fold protein [Nocardioides sp.]|uniref:alpha/beta hydrolase-fold protein n=1 Tax=Nocardioides sp. TaxID=35761 RepID=UPI0039E30F7F
MSTLASSPTDSRRLHRSRALATASVLAIATVTGAGAPAAHASATASGAASPATAHRGASSPVVTHTGRKPTGYQVRFRYHDAKAALVRITGSWYFTNPDELSSYTTGPEELLETTGRLPADWRVGDFPVSSPNSSFPNWPVADMTRHRGGDWSYTTPLPSGPFTYSFEVCSDAAGTDCETVADPQNLPWNESHGSVQGTQITSSEVYVPSDPAFGTVDLSYQGPARVQGTLTHTTFPSSTSVPPADEAYVSVYTPPGYDAHRSTPYPTLYMFGGGDNEMEWTTTGDLQNILDNLIATGQVEPMVVVMASDKGETEDYDGFPELTTNVLDTLIPWTESHYDVSADADRRAIAGQGFGGSIAQSMLYNHTDTFGYYGIMSPGSRANFTTPDDSTVTDAQVAAMKTKGIFVSGGYLEPAVTPFGSSHGGHWYHAQAVKALTDLGVPVTPDFVFGGHDMYTWRITIHDFLTRVAFRPTPTS